MQGPLRSGAALCVVHAVFLKGKLDAGRIQFARADEGLAPAGRARWGKRRHPGGGRADYEKVVSGMSEVRGWGVSGAPRSGAALCAVQAFFRRKNLDAGRIQFARADEGAGALAGLQPAGASAGTQAEDALTMKRLYQAACG